MTETILLVEDDAAVASMYAQAIGDAGHQVEHVVDGRVALERASDERHALIVLDVGLPGLNGFDLVRELRYRRLRVPVLIVSGRDREIDRVLGVELGADAYLVKPVGLTELMARVKALLRREAMAAQPSRRLPNARVRLGPVEIDREGRQVRRDGVALTLTAREYDLLLYLALHPGRVFTPGQLLQAVWKTDFAGYETNVKTFVNRLRGRIESDPSRPELVLTVRGTGYRSAAAQP
jgi:DNA-binding response OmpR family regulator